MAPLAETVGVRPGRAVVGSAVVGFAFVHAATPTNNASTSTTSARRHIVP